MTHEITYFSMFTGVGGFDLGFAQSKRRFRCVGFSEIDKFAGRVLRKRFPGIRNYGDITKVRAGDLPDFDLLCGGFPCQAFSIAGKRRGFRDARGALFFEIARVLRAKRPSLVLLENVKGLLGHEGGATYRVVLQTLGRLGYDVQWMVLNSKFFGVPQNRQRVFLVGSLAAEGRPQVLPLRPNGQKAPQLRQDQTNALKAAREPSSYVAECKQLPETKGRPQGERIYRTTGVGKTLIGSGGGSGGRTGLYVQGAGVRRLTPKECERLQGFPDDWTKSGVREDGNDVPISDSQRYRQMGNAVTVNVVQALADRLADARLRKRAKGDS